MPFVEFAAPLSSSKLHCYTATLLLLVTCYLLLTAAACYLLLAALLFYLLACLAWGWPCLLAHSTDFWLACIIPIILVPYYFPVRLSPSKINLILKYIFSFFILFLYGYTHFIFRLFLSFFFFFECMVDIPFCFFRYHPSLRPVHSGCCCLSLLLCPAAAAAPQPSARSILPPSSNHP